jgi:cytochrome P450
MTVSETAALKPEVIRDLFDLRGDQYVARGGTFDVDLYPILHRLRETGPVHEGAPGDLVGYTGPSDFVGLPMPDRPHFTVFDFEGCTRVVREKSTFSASQHEPGSAAYENESMILFMDGQRHRRLRGLVQRAFLPTHADWWIDNWIADTVDELIGLIAGNGRADLNVEFFAPIPLLTICRSFGVSVSDALEIRAGVLAEAAGLTTIDRLVSPIIQARRTDPRDDLISLLVQAELKDDDGSKHRLSDGDVLIFSVLLLAAGSGTTWKQLGITMLTLLQHPAWLQRVKDDPDVIRNVVEETMRWYPTDPVFARYAICGTEIHGVKIPKGAVVHPCFASANRDPLRWERPDEFDPGREVQTSLGFGGGTHVCLGQHVARAEICTAIGTLLTRLPGLRLDPDAEPPKLIGMYERGPTSVPVVWDLRAEAPTTVK